MSFRNQMIASSALLFISLCGESSLVSSAETVASGETCVRESYAVRHEGHPGKKILLPKRDTRETDCAKSARKVLMLASFTDAAGGQALVQGDAERAMKQLHAQRASKSPNVMINRCVAYTVQRQWVEARGACDAAVEGAKRQREMAFGRPSLSNPANRELSAAYSNRAVLNWLLSDEAAAHNDLAKARRYAPHASYVQRNSEAADRLPSLAGNRSPAG